MFDLHDTPHMVYADAAGRIFDHPHLRMAGVDGAAPQPVPADAVIAMPRGSDLFTLPGRTPIGIDPATGEATVFEGDDLTAGGPVQGVAAFLAPAHTITHLAAYRRRPEAPALPLFAYAAVGFRDDTFWVTGLRIDPDPRQDPWRFDGHRLAGQVARGVASAPGNRLVRQLERCALEYGCRAAQNFFIGRHEAPLPTSIACNAQCVGCISLQPDGSFKASHDRLQVAPTPQEVADVALAHLERVPDGVVSFGQGCEGEPLMMGDLLVEAVRRIRATTPRGTINLNTNGSLPEVVERLAAAGLDAMRVSINSPRTAIYDAYYQPRGYRLDAIEASIMAMRRRDRFVSLNYLVFPGVSDTDEELAALEPFIERTGLNMIQWRNLNIDPEVYARALPDGLPRPGFGMRTLIERLRTRFPELRHGYFNPALASVR